jgi:hypothetical protein
MTHNILIDTNALIAVIDELDKRKNFRLWFNAF